MIFRLLNILHMKDSKEKTNMKYRRIMSQQFHLPSSPNVYFFLLRILLIRFCCLPVWGENVYAVDDTDCRVYIFL